LERAQLIESPWAPIRDAHPVDVDAVILPPGMSSKPCIYRIAAPIYSPITISIQPVHPHAERKRSALRGCFERVGS
jgi:hypothetical protein